MAVVPDRFHAPDFGGILESTHECAEIPMACTRPRTCQAIASARSFESNFVSGLLIPSWMLGFAGMPMAVALLATPAVMFGLYKASYNWGKRNRGSRGLRAQLRR